MTTIKDLHSAQTRSNQKSRIHEARQDSKLGREDKPSGTQANDSVEISTAGAQLANINKALESVPVVNAEKVSEIRNSIEAGSFEISSERIADKVIASELDRLSATSE
ncbi:MAG: flagellar biosynthesis anti-sigma factor FlgM [bacterium]